MRGEGQRGGRKRSRKRGRRGEKERGEVRRRLDLEVRNSNGLTECF